MSTFHCTAVAVSAIALVCTVQLTGNLTCSRLVSADRVLASCEDCTREGGVHTREYVCVRALELDAQS